MRRLMDYHCKTCALVFEDYLEVGQLPIKCPSCSGEEIQEIWTKPADIRTSDAATYLDGTNPGMKELRKSYEIEAKSYNLRPKDRGEAKKEIAGLRRGKR